MLKVIRRELVPAKEYFIQPMSDIHIGNASFDERAFIRDLKRARELNARLLFIGDVFDMLLPKDTKRFKPTVLADWLLGKDDVINPTVNKAFDLLKDYADLIDMISLGNHEESVIKYHSFDPVSALIQKLNDAGGNITHGGYVGFVRYTFRASDSSTTLRSTDILYYHGKGGGAEVTKGFIDFNRVQTKFTYDMFVCGHKHYRNADGGDVKLGLNRAGTLEARQQYHVQCGTYERTYHDGDGVSFGEMKLFAEKNTGSPVVKLRVSGTDKQVDIRVEI